jgi:toxin ParE1/3/4
MRVVITAAAKADLLAIRRTIAADNPARAVTFTEELLDRCQALADTPRTYPLVPRYERFGIRRCVHGDGGPALVDRIGRQDAFALH